MQIKLVIWDLDDTLWQGTLAECDDVALFQQRAEMVRSLNRCGIVSSLCSKNDARAAEAVLRKFGLWDEFVFPHLAFTPKGVAVQQIIEDMQLRAANVLFVDDNRLNLREVQALLPDIHVVDATTADCDMLLVKILDDNRHVKKSRIEEYRILESKKKDRHQSPQSNEEFLRSCGIQAIFPYLMDNLDFSGRLEELINRTNQLNYTETRVENGSLEKLIVDVVGYDTWSVFVWDNYGYYGLVGFAMVDRAAAKFIHLTFSCRVMHMGIEAATLRKVREKFPNIDLAGLKKTLPDIEPDWVTVEDFNNPAMRGKVLAQEVPHINPAPKIRIMFDCQSGGIAHYSRWRDVIDFDNAPRLFAMRMVTTGEFETQNYPPMLVYGAGIDYTSPRWPNDTVDLQPEVYMRNVHKLCVFVMKKGCKLLVVLPPENMPEEKYRPHMNYTRERAIQLNQVWRNMVPSFSDVTLLEMSAFAKPEDMIDVSHYHAAFLKKIASSVDLWCMANIDHKWPGLGASFCQNDKPVGVKND